MIRRTTLSASPPGSLGHGLRIYLRSLVIILVLPSLPSVRSQPVILSRLRFRNRTVRPPDILPAVHRPGVHQLPNLAPSRAHRRSAPHMSVRRRQSFLLSWITISKNKKNRTVQRSKLRAWTLGHLPLINAGSEALEKGKARLLRPRRRPRTRRWLRSRWPHNRWRAKSARLQGHLLRSQFSASRRHLPVDGDPFSPSSLCRCTACPHPSSPVDRLPRLSRLSRPYHACGLHLCLPHQPLWRRSRQNGN